MGDSWNKKEREKKKQKERKEKEEKKQERKEHTKDGNSLDGMMAYIDENGNISDRPPDPRRKIEVNLEDIQIGVPKQVEPVPGENRRTGKVSFFNTQKGFGFIKDIVTQESIFVHANALSEEIRENDKVTFEVEMGHRGPNAIDVKVEK